MRKTRFYTVWIWFCCFAISFSDLLRMSWILPMSGSRSGLGYAILAALCQKLLGDRTSSSVGLARPLPVCGRRNESTRDKTNVAAAKPRTLAI